MQNIVVSLTETELKALSVVAVSPEEWIENAAKSRAQTAIEEIVQICVAKCLEEQVQIPSSREEIVDLAIAKGWVKIVSSEVSNGENPA